MEQEPYRRNHHDVTDGIFVADPRAVHGQVGRILAALYAGADLTPIEHAFDVFARLFTGELEGYLGCDTWYHDAQHSLDCALVMARLIDGHERDVGQRQRLGPRRAVLGVIAALFHDAGYIRHVDDPELHGAQFSLYHVRRSGAFLADFLPAVGFADEAAMTEQLVHFTGYEVALEQVDVHGALDRRLGFLLGTADILAQMSDRCYLEKCRDCLYPEFEICGLAGEPIPGGPEPVYNSPAGLLEQTPNFIDLMMSERIEGYFESVHRHAATHFGGRDLYMDMIGSHRTRLEYALERADVFDGLRRRPECINAAPLRVILGLQMDDEDARAQARPPVVGDLRRTLGLEA